MSHPKLKRILCLSSALLFASTACGQSPLHIQVLFSETANLTYQLDVVAGVLGHVNPADYQALWKAEFIKSDEDRALIRQWAELKRRYDTSVQVPAPDMPLQMTQSYVSLGDGIRIAGLRATSDERFLDAASLLMKPEDATRLGQVVTHFSPIFHAWWKREPASKGQRFVRAVRGLLDRPSLREQIERFRHFYGPTLPEGSTAYFSLLYRPDRAKAPTSGQQLGNVGAVEFLPKEKPERRLDVVLHEFCHYLYDSRSDEATLAMQRRFLETNDRNAKPALNLLNEALATALGNGIIGREFRPPTEWPAYVNRPLSFYNNPSIDRAGKRALALLDPWLAQGKTLDDPAFAKTYVDALKETFGDSLTSPILFLNEALIFVDERFGREFAHETRTSLKIASAYTQVSAAVDADSLSGYRQQEHLSAVFVVSSAQIDALVAQKLLSSSEGDAVKAQASQHKSALVGVERSPMAYTFLIVADDVTNARKQIDLLAKEPAMFLGLHKDS